MRQFGPFIKAARYEVQTRKDSSMVQSPYTRGQFGRDIGEPAASLHRKLRRKITYHVVAYQPSQQFGSTVGRGQTRQLMS